jgi:hypothetical protein
MVQRTNVGAPSVARVLALLASVALAIGLAGACTDLPGGLGASCIKDQDCQSGVCTQLLCAAVPPYLDAQVQVPEAGADATIEGSTAPADDGAADTATDAPVASESAAPDVATPVDSSPPVDAPVESSTQDAQEDAHPEASTADAPADGATDAPADGHPDDAG